MTLSKRVEKLENQSGAGEGVKIIISVFLPVGQGTPIGYLGQVLTPEGWQTVSSDGETTEDEFEKRLRDMAEGQN